MNLLKFYDSSHLFWAVMLLLLLIMSILIVITYCGSACCSLLYVLQCWCIISPHIFSSRVTQPACNWKMVFVRVWSKCTAQHRMTASKSALQLLCFFEKGLSQLLQICWCFFISIKRARAPELFLSPSALAFPAHLTESLLEGFPLCLKACWHSGQGHCRQGAHKWSKLDIVLKCDCIRSGLSFLVGMSFFFFPTASKREKETQNLCEVGEKTRAILQTLCPQEGMGEYKEGIENVIQSAEASDTAAYASSEDDFLENRKLCREHDSLEPVEAAAFWWNFMIYQIRPECLLSARSWSMLPSFYQKFSTL